MWKNRAAKDHLNSVCCHHRWPCCLIPVRHAPELSHIFLSLYFAKLSKTNPQFTLKRQTHHFSIVLHLCPLEFLFLHRAGKHCPLNFSHCFPRFPSVEEYTLISWKEKIRTTKMDCIASAFGGECVYPNT